MECEQSSGQTILDHGISVWSHLEELQDYLTNPDITLDSSRWKVPRWLSENRDVLASHLLPRRTLKAYTIYHDCGKPRCLEVDSDGRRHFPNHAAHSARVWRDHVAPAFSPDIREPVEFLIRNDMNFHVMTAAETQKFIEETHPSLGVSLLLTALAEIHANAQMFGGTESTSFKIKWKRLEKRGNQYVRQLTTPRRSP